jgi:light-regulated signal transduction histidine kinase (bacteriophytochrome)
MRALAVRSLRLENARLETQVRRHVQELEQANSDLEAFAHSAAHDLRAPLHVVDGFSHMLSTRCAAYIDEKATYYISRIRAATGQMGQLVDALLRLARIGRAAVQRQEVDVRELVQGVMEQLREEKVLLGDWVSVEANLPRVQADPGCCGKCSPTCCPMRASSPVCSTSRASPWGFPMNPAGANTSCGTTGGV